MASSVHGHNGQYTRAAHGRPRHSDLTDGDGNAGYSLPWTDDELRTNGKHASTVTTTLTIDPEFQNLIPPQTDEERAGLQMSILDEGCREPLVVWKDHNILVDGHHRYAICVEHGVPFQVTEKAFDSRDDVIIWMVRNQLARRNISTFSRSDLALASEEAFARKAKANQGTRTDIPQNSAECFAPIETRVEVAKLADVSHDTIHKVKRVKKSAPKFVRDKARAGNLSVNRAYLLTKALENAAPDVLALVERMSLEEPEKVEILKRLYQSGKGADSNGTFEEIARTGGFAYGDEMEHHCVFADASVTEINRALKSLEEHHRRLAVEQKRRQQEEAAEKAAAALSVDETYNILHGDIRRLFNDLEDSSVDLFFTDPPYHAGKTETYAVLAELAAAKLKPGGLCLAYSGQMHLPQVLAAMSEHLTYWWTFAIRMTQGHLDIWNRKVWNDWKPVLVFAKADPSGRLLAAPEWTQDFIEGGGRDKRYHRWGQDANEATYWIERLTQVNDLVCDPYVGGAAIPVACKLTGRCWIGIDCDEKAVGAARVRLSEVLRHDPTASF